MECLFQRRRLIVDIAVFHPGYLAEETFGELFRGLVVHQDIPRFRKGFGGSGEETEILVVFRDGGHEFIRQVDGALRQGEIAFRQGSGDEFLRRPGPVRIVRIVGIIRVIGIIGVIGVVWLVRLVWIRRVLGRVGFHGLRLRLGTGGCHQQAGKEGQDAELDFHHTSRGGPCGLSAPPPTAKIVFSANYI